MEMLKNLQRSGIATVYDEHNFAHVKEMENEVVFSDLKSIEEANKAFLKVTPFFKVCKVFEKFRQIPGAKIEDTDKAFGKNRDSAIFFSYIQNEGRKGEIYLCEHNEFTYRIEMHCTKNDSIFWGQLMVDEFYFVD